MSNGENILGRGELDRIADIFKLFADGTRLAILQELKPGPRSVTQLVDELGTTQANISKHLRVLHDEGLLKREKQGQHVFYSVDDEIIFPLCELVCGKLNRDAEAARSQRFEI